MTLIVVHKLSNVSSAVNGGGSDCKTDNTDAYSHM